MKSPSLVFDAGSGFLLLWHGVPNRAVILGYTPRMVVVIFSFGGVCSHRANSFQDLSVMRLCLLYLASNML